MGRVQIRAASTIDFVAKRLLNFHNRLQYTVIAV